MLLAALGPGNVFSQIAIFFSKMAVVTFGGAYAVLAAARRATIAVTRDSITYAPTGLGYGAANTRIIVARGRWADTITTSRLGRVSF